MIAVDASEIDSHRLGAARELFEGNFRCALPKRPALYDVHPDGQRFVMVEERESAAFAREIPVVLNWFQELEHLLPSR